MEINKVEKIVEDLYYKLFDDSPRHILDVEGIVLLPTEDFQKLFDELNELMPEGHKVEPDVSKITFRSRTGIKLRMVEAKVEETEVILTR